MEGSPAPTAPGSKPRFDLTAGRLCLDFVNTLSSRGSDHPKEGLASYDDLLVWGRQAGLVTDQQLETLRGMAKARPQEAEAALRRARELRETLFRVFRSLVRERPIQTDDLELLNGELTEALSHARLVSPDGERFTWDWVDEPSMNVPLWRVARSAADLLTGPDPELVRICAFDPCQWVFVDTTRNRSRQWCDMRSCGNRAKARRFYERRKRRAADAGGTGA